MIKWRGHILSLLIIFSLIAAGISPACKFISGGTALIEICSLEGLKKITVPAEQAPSKSRHHEHKNRDQCQFCFSFAKVKTAKTYPVIVTALAANKSQSFLPSVSAFIPRRDFDSFSPRGPPGSA